MGNAGRSVFNILIFIQFLIIGVGLGLSAYILSLAPTLDNVLSIVFVAFTGFALLSTIVGMLGSCSESKCLLKCHGVMGIVCILIFAIIAILSGLWYGGVDVLPDFEFSGRNVTELCESFNRTEFLNNQNQLLIEEITGNNVDPLPEAQIMTTEVPTTTVPTTTTTTTISTTEKPNWTFDEGRILLYYCRVEDFVRDIIFGRRTDGSVETSDKSAKIMLGILIVACILFLFYLISTALGFYNARRVSSSNFY